MSAPLVLTAPPQIHRTAIFARERTLRYELRRWWVEEPKRWAAWLMLNPSNANAERDDPTVLRVTHFTRAWGYDGWVGINLYPLVASEPKRMWRWSRWTEGGPDWSVRDDLQHNRGHIEEVARTAALRMVAFGREGDTDPAWLEQCLEAYGQPGDTGGDERFYCLGTGRTGQPLHPMARGKWRVPDEAQPILWEGMEVKNQEADSGLPASAEQIKKDFPEGKCAHGEVLENECPKCADEAKAGKQP